MAQQVVDSWISAQRRTLSSSPGYKATRHLLDMGGTASAPTSRRPQMIKRVSRINLPVRCGQRRALWCWKRLRPRKETVGQEEVNGYFGGAQPGYKGRLARCSTESEVVSHHLTKNHSWPNQVCTLIHSDDGSGYSPTTTTQCTTHTLKSHQHSHHRPRDQRLHRLDYVRGRIKRVSRKPDRP